MAQPNQPGGLISSLLEVSTVFSSSINFCSSLRISIDVCRMIVLSFFFPKVFQERNLLGHLYHKISIEVLPRRHIWLLIRNSQPWTFLRFYSHFRLVFKMDLKLAGNEMMVYGKFCIGNHSGMQDVFQVTLLHYIWMRSQCLGSGWIQPVFIRFFSGQCLWYTGWCSA